MIQFKCFQNSFNNKLNHCSYHAPSFFFLLGMLYTTRSKIYLPLPIVLGALICPAKVLIFLVPFEDRCVQRVINKRLLSGETQKDSLKDAHLPERQAYFCLSLFFLSGMLMLYLFTVLRLRKWS